MERCERADGINVSDWDVVGGGSSKAGGKDGRSGWEFLRGTLGTLGRYSRQYRSLIEPRYARLVSGCRAVRSVSQSVSSVQSNSRQSAKLGGARPGLN